MDCKHISLSLSATTITLLATFALVLTRPLSAPFPLLYECVCMCVCCELWPWQTLKDKPQSAAIMCPCVEEREDPEWGGRGGLE